MARKMPAQKPGRSETVVSTPDVFIKAVKRLLVIEYFDADLAANLSNAKAPFFYAKEDDSLSQNWKNAITRHGWGWLNPPYDDIAPWAMKCAMGNRNIALLVPASVGSNWWRDWVHEIAHVKFLNGRVTFDGHTGPYPKDLALCLYCDRNLFHPGYDIWTWKDDTQ